MVTYRAEICASLTRLLGLPAGPPRVICDGCGTEELVVGKAVTSYKRRLEAFYSGKRPRWPKGWLCVLDGDGSRDLCPVCRKAPK